MHAARYDGPVQEHRSALRKKPIPTTAGRRASDSILTTNDDHTKANLGTHGSPTSPYLISFVTPSGKQSGVLPALAWSSSRPLWTGIHVLLYEYMYITRAESLNCERVSLTPRHSEGQSTPILTHICLALYMYVAE